MLKIGVHVSISNGFAGAIEIAKSKSCNCAQIFSHSPRSWFFQPINAEDIEEFRFRYGKENIKPIVIHESYLTNLATYREELYRKTMAAMIKEIEIAGMLGLKYLVIHPGAHTGIGERYGLARISSSLRSLSSLLDENDVNILLETTAGTGTNLGYRFEQIREIIEKSEIDAGVVLDTCHVYAAGYDIATSVGLEKTIEEFDGIIGLKRLKLIHLNDSKGGLGSRIDRHEHIGLGNIGVEGFKMIINHPELRDIPMILETPVDDRRDDIENINFVRSLYNY